MDKLKKVEYDKESQAIYITVSEGQIDHSQELTPDVILDMDKNETLIGIDILNVSLIRQHIPEDKVKAVKEMLVRASLVDGFAQYITPQIIERIATQICQLFERPKVK